MNFVKKSLLTLALLLPLLVKADQVFSVSGSAWQKSDPNGLGNGIYTNSGTTFTNYSVVYTNYFNTNGSGWHFEWGANGTINLRSTTNYYYYTKRNATSPVGNNYKQFNVIAVGNPYPNLVVSDVTPPDNVVFPETNVDNAVTPTNDFTIQIQNVPVSTDLNTNDLFLMSHSTNNGSSWQTRNIPVYVLDQLLLDLINFNTNFFNVATGSVSLADSAILTPDQVSITSSGSTISTPASIPGGLIQLTNLDLTPFFTNAVAGTNIPVFSLTNRLIIGTVPSFYGGNISGFVPVSPMNPLGVMTIEVSTDGGATWQSGSYGNLAIKTTALVSIYDAGGGDDIATNLTVTGFVRPSYVGTTNDYRNQVVQVDDPSIGDNREAVNVETAKSLATGVRAYWANDAAQADVNLAAHDLLFDSIWRQHIETGQWQLQANHQAVLTADYGTSAGTAPVIESLTVTSNLLFSVLTTETPTMQYVTNLANTFYVDVPSQTAWFSNSLWYVSAPIPAGITDSSFFRARIAGTNVVSAKFTVRGSLVVPVLQVTNLTLTVTSAPPVNPTSPVVWFCVTNNGVAYKVGGYQ